MFLLLIKKILYTPFSKVSFEMLKKIMNRDDLFPSVLVSVRSAANVLGVVRLKDNLAVVDWHMPTSLMPYKYAISVRNENSIRGMISESGNFVVNFMGHEHKSTILFCENQDGLFIDLFAHSGITKADSDMVESPRVKEAKAFLECEVEQELESGDHTIFIGRVVGPRV